MREIAHSKKVSIEWEMEDVNDAKKMKEHFGMCACERDEATKESDTN